MMKKFYRLLSYVLVAALASACTLLYTVPRERAAATSKLDALAGLIAERFIGEVDQTQMLDAAARGMVSSLGDRWSYYIPAAQYGAHMERMNNAYVGIGVTILVEDAGFSVTKVTPGGPAEEAGVLSGDLITAVDGTEVAGMTTDEVGVLVRGEAGTEVVLTVLRGTEKCDLTVTRREIRTPVATAELLEGGIGLVTIANFDSRCYDESVAAIESLLAQGARALIFDVRYNPGGYKHELVKLLDYLLPEGPLFRSEYYTGEIEVDESDARCLDIPMAVLVNGDSYSAAEFFAAALSEYEAATVIGEQTCGKGYYQETYKLSDGSAIGLSVGKYTTPNGVSLAGVGITPDIVIPVDEETAFGIYAGTLDARDDPQICAAAEALLAELDGNE